MKTKEIVIIEVFNNDWVLYEIVENCTSLLQALQLHEEEMGVDIHDPRYEKPEVKEEDGAEALYSNEIDARACEFPITTLTKE